MIIVVTVGMVKVVRSPPAGVVGVASSIVGVALMMVSMTTVGVALTPVSRTTVGVALATRVGVVWWEVGVRGLWCCQ